MSEITPAVPAVAKKAYTKDQIYAKNVDRMSDRQMSGHLRRQARNKKEKLDGVWATVLSSIFDSKVAPFLR